MMTSAAIHPPNALLFVMDLKTGEIPETMGGQFIVSTPSSIVVATLAAVDGDTVVMLTDERARVREVPGLRRVFSGVLQTPRKELCVCTVLLEPVVKLPVSSTQSKVEIWANRDREPSALCVLVNV
jgi:hypothetical protein